MPRKQAIKYSSGNREPTASCSSEPGLFSTPRAPQPESKRLKRTINDDRRIGTSASTTLPVQKNQSEHRQIDEIIQQFEALSVLLNQQQIACGQIISNLHDLNATTPSFAPSVFSSRPFSTHSAANPNPTASATALLYPISQRVPTAVYVQETIWKLVTAVHDRNAQHDMFGPTEVRKIRLPYQEAGRNPLSWESKVQGIGRDVGKVMGPWILPGSCWMKKEQSIVISGKTQCLIVRLVAFLTNPTDKNWYLLTSTYDERRDPYGKRITAYQSPFVHQCNNGHGSVGKNQPGCVNGTQHGYFSDAKDNASYRNCDRNAGVTFCQGHGDALSRVKCIYVHPDGIVKPCLNRSDIRPMQCNCPEPKCF
ncbi:hypothetical protein MMC28_011278 [Mycoblastus sanguinarius]|nr:hypothetical protein [Mycoblastus sanguinarius]